MTATPTARPHRAATPVTRAVPAPLLPRRQPPVRSPLPMGAWVRAWARAAGDPREVLADRLRDRFTADGVLLTDSGTTALRLAIRSAVPEGGVVALPAFSCYDVATAAVGANVRIVLYDLSPGTLGPDLASLDGALAVGAAAVVVAPLYGIPVDWDAVSAVADRHGALLIEDAAQGHGACWRGHPVGALGPCSILSFGRGKGWTGSGGGALLWRGWTPVVERVEDTAAAGVARAAVAALAQSWLGRPHLYWLPAAVPGLRLGETRYRPPGSIRRMGAFQAALVLETESAADREAGARRANAESIRAHLRGSHVVTPMPPTGAVAGWLRFPVLVSNGLYGLRDPTEAARLGAAPSYPAPLAHLEPVRERLVDPRQDPPGALRLAHELITLPTHGAVTPVDGERLSALVPGTSPSANEGR